MSNGNSQVEMYPIEKIKLSGINPARRTARDTLKDLRTAIQEVGFIIQPLILSMDDLLLDGHRRLACAIDLGWKEVPVIHRDLAVGQFAMINSTQQRMSGRQQLEVGLAGGGYGPVMRRHLDEIRLVGGDEMIEQIFAEKISPTVIVTGKAARQYCGLDRKDSAVMKIIMDWLISGHRQYQVRIAMTGGIPPQKLWKAIIENRDVSPRW
jgi:hypothetical protein